MPFSRFGLAYVTVATLGVGAVAYAVADAVDAAPSPLRPIAFVAGVVGVDSGVHLAYRGDRPCGCFAVRGCHPCAQIGGPAVRQGGCLVAQRLGGGLRLVWLQSLGSGHLVWRVWLQVRHFVALGVVVALGWHGLGVG